MRNLREVLGPVVCLLPLIAGGAPIARAGLAAGGGPAPTGDAAAAPAIPAQRGWPRTFEKGGNTMEVYQPQIDSWKNYDVIEFRAAIAVTPAGASQTMYGVLAGQADTVIDKENRMVILTDPNITMQFPGVPPAKAAEVQKLAAESLGKRQYIDVSLDEVLAYMHTATKTPTVPVNLKPPPIYYRDSPAILVIYLGQPQFKPIQDTQLMFAVNTNWAVLMDTATSKYYLLDGDSWLTSPDPLKGPWTAAQTLPAEFLRLPAGGNWDQVLKNVPGEPFKVVPAVITSTEPAELILTNGPPAYTPIAGTRLMYVSNPQMPVFLDLTSRDYYYLAAGRWFRAPALTGPWAAASADLPAEFAKIPQDSPVGYVLASVPHTQEAEDAILLASVPHKATVSIKEATVTVTYDGPPKFEPIQGTTMTYAVNTPYEVIFAGGQYYCCYNGVWFVSPASTGAWKVATAVPAVIYTIPPASPVYNVTYVRVYSVTPTTVVVGYTGGYSGQYVAATGALMFGAGVVTGALLASSDYWYAYHPAYYSYGCAAHYSYAYGGYYRAGGAYYGPHGGAGWGAAYNPATGTWGRAGYAYGPAGAHYGAQAYNPFTNTYAQHTGGTNGYHSWGSTAVAQDGRWAQAGHVSGPVGSAGWAETSSGNWAEAAHAGQSTVARTSGGDVYAGHDGNVYKNSGGQWQRYEGGGNWSDVSRPSTTQDLSHDSWARDHGSANAFSSWESRAGAARGGFAGGFHGGGFRGGGFRR
jgi:hypothetical protein